MASRAEMIRSARRRVDARRDARNRADIRDQARATYGRNLGRTRFAPTKQRVGSGGDKLLEIISGASGDLKRKGSNIKDAFFPLAQKAMQGIASIGDNIRQSRQNREILGDVYTDDLRKSMMTDDDLEFYNKYVRLADLATDNQEKERLMGVANTAMQNANITRRINYALGQPGFGFETTATAGQKPFSGDENIDYSTLVDRMVGGLRATKDGKDFYNAALATQENEPGGSLLSDAMKNYGRGTFSSDAERYPLYNPEIPGVRQDVVDIMPIIEGVSNQPNIDAYNEIIPPPFNAADIYGNLTLQKVRDKIFPGMNLEDITQEDLDNLSNQDKTFLGYVGPI
jgi:hypothetical protein